MSAKKEALGKGIRALLTGIDEDLKGGPGIEGKLSSSGTAMLPLDKIEINPFQPRADFDEEALANLADSIKVHGVIQPITVRLLDNNKYQLIAGERRLRASKMAKKTEIPAFVRKADDQEMLEIALIENIQREDLNAIEIAINYQRLLIECELTQENLAGRLGKNRSTVTNYLRLLKLPPEIQEGIKEKKISMGHARAIISVEDPVAQLVIYKEILEKGLSVRKVEALSRQLQKTAAKPSKKATKDELPLAYRKIQDELGSLLSTKVRMKVNENGSGEIIVSYFSDEELDRLIEQFSNI